MLAKRFPVHVTWRINRQVWSLRTNRFFRVLERVMYAGAKEDFRVVHYAFEKDHIHLIVEAWDRSALSKGMKGLGVRVARAVNRIMKRRGNVVRRSARRSRTCTNRAPFIAGSRRRRAASTSGSSGTRWRRRYFGGSIPKLRVRSGCRAFRP